MKKYLILCLFALTGCVSPWTINAQQSQGLSVTPPFAQITVKPGDTFRSYVKVINPNDFPLTVYATPVNFETANESGHPKFIPLVDQEVDSATFAGWIDVTNDPITIAPETSIDVNYTIAVPSDASPGGHFAALLIGTRPPSVPGEQLALKTSQVVSALFLARVEGDITEKGQIREFSVLRSFASTPQADFILRFQNDGNVYLQPQGDITIYNMWGKERGFIPVNHKTNFGNVLPNSIRKFEFSWEGTPSLTDIGRYKAVATLGYGVEGQTSVMRTVYFWVIPVKATLITLALLSAFIAFITFSIRLYIRHALKMAGHIPDSREVSSIIPRTSRRPTRKEMVAPLREGVLDLRRSVRPSSHRAVNDTQKNGILGFFVNYRIFLFSSLIGITGLCLIVWFILDARTAERPYEVTVKHDEQHSTTLSSEEVLHEQMNTGTPELDDVSAGEETIRQLVSIVNASGESGRGASLALLLEKEGYRVADISTDADGRDDTVVIANADKLEIATALSELLDGAPLSIRPQGEETAPEILIIIGKE